VEEGEKAEDGAVEVEGEGGAEEEVDAAGTLACE